MRAKPAISQIHEHQTPRSRVDDRGGRHLHARGGIGLEIDACIHAGQEFERLVRQLDPHMPSAGHRIEVGIDVRNLGVVGMLGQVVERDARMLSDLHVRQIRFIDLCLDPNLVQRGDAIELHAGFDRAACHDVLFDDETARGRGNRNAFRWSAALLERLDVALAQAEQVEALPSCAPERFWTCSRPAGVRGSDARSRAVGGEQEVLLRVVELGAIQ